jgi:hypothetical protein
MALVTLHECSQLIREDSHVRRMFMPCDMHRLPHVVAGIPASICPCFVAVLYFSLCASHWSTISKHTVTCSRSATNKCGFRIWWLDFIISSSSHYNLSWLQSFIALSLFHMFNNLCTQQSTQSLCPSSLHLWLLTPWTLTATVGTHSLHSTITLCNHTMLLWPITVDSLNTVSNTLTLTDCTTHTDTLSWLLYIHSLTNTD